MTTSKASTTSIAAKYGTARRTVTVHVNERDVTREVSTRTTLADFLRDELGLVSVHLGCEHGECGSCTVLFDGHSVRSCLMLAVQTDGHTVETVESLAGNPAELHPIQEAFAEEQGLQCGFCTPAMVLRTKEIIETGRDRELTDAEVRHEISGILCRCTGYQNIVRAVQSAQRRCRGGGRDA
ncbi:(2Fe-2S)-binding protein [Streptomyces jeddahensis]|uniref:Caffeine dehydrogenase subunit gamma n=1 Tax=Streptomyces jeddahensis TaxID=1716141 RepID=A0A177HUQ2_9ACTN|nr:(2Fe-2S)-binding protein [Streptomyces jeddahensis]OAH14603.1 caffeine dehydrogenase subunit gamma [Streptomyces jeddahensis]